MNGERDAAQDWRVGTRRVGEADVDEIEPAPERGEAEAALKLKGGLLVEEDKDAARGAEGGT